MIAVTSHEYDQRMNAGLALKNFGVAESLVETLEWHAIIASRFDVVFCHSSATPAIKSHTKTWVKPGGAWAEYDDVPPAGT